MLYLRPLGLYSQQIGDYQICVLRNSYFQEHLCEQGFWGQLWHTRVIGSWTTWGLQLYLKETQKFSRTPFLIEHLRTTVSGSRTIIKSYIK